MFYHCRTDEPNLYAKECHGWALSYLPCDRTNGVKANIQEDGSLADVAENLSCVRGGLAHHSWYVVQGIV